MRLFFVLWVVVAVKPAFGLRVISTSPQATELFFQLHKGTDLIATSEWSQYPEAAKKLPSIGPLFTPSLERTVMLHPDGVLVDSTASNPAYETALTSLGLRSFRLNIHTLADLFADSERLLRAWYQESPPASWKKARACFQALERRSPKPFTFLAFVWLSPPIVYDSQSFLSDLLTTVGGRSAIPREWVLDYPTVSEEWLLRQTVDRVYYLDDHPQAGPIARAQTAKWWPRHKVRLIALSPEHFGRASFTPLEHLKELGIDVPGECGDAG